MSSNDTSNSAPDNNSSSTTTTTTPASDPTSGGGGNGNNGNGNGNGSGNGGTGGNSGNGNGDGGGNGNTGGNGGNTGNTGGGNGNGNTGGDNGNTDNGSGTGNGNGGSTSKPPSGTSGNNNSDGGGQSRTPDPTDASATPSNTNNVQTHQTILTTPSPSVIEATSIITLPNGDVITTSLHSTTTLPAGATVIVTSSLVHRNSHTKSIVGGVVGGLAALSLLIVAGWLFLRHRRQRRAKESFNGNFDPDITSPVSGSRPVSQYGTYRTAGGASAGAAGASGGRGSRLSGIFAPVVGVGRRSKDGHERMQPTLPHVDLDDADSMETDPSSQGTRQSAFLAGAVPVSMGGAGAMSHEGYLNRPISPPNNRPISPVHVAEHRYSTLSQHPPPPSAYPAQLNEYVHNNGGGSGGQAYRYSRSSRNSRSPSPMSRDYHRGENESLVGHGSMDHSSYGGHGQAF